MKTGMNLLLWTTHVTSDHFPILEKLKKTGFDGVEIPIFEGDAGHYKTIRKQLDNLGLGCTTVTVATPDANPISPDAKLRQAAVERMKWVIEMNAILGSSLVAGPYHSPLAVFSGQGPTADEKARAADTLRQVAEDRPAAQGHARHRIPEPLRVLLPDDRGRRPGAGAGGEPSLFSHDVRHLSCQH